MRLLRTAAGTEAPHSARYVISYGGSELHNAAGKA